MLMLLFHGLQSEFYCCLFTRSSLIVCLSPSGQTYDPIYAAAIQSNNVALHTIFKSQNGLLTLISVTPFWSVALKLVRYTKWDPGDICLLLRCVELEVKFCDQTILVWRAGSEIDALRGA